MTAERDTAVRGRDQDMPCAGLRVVELGEFVAAPYAGKLLADLGADVIKVEQPGCGDPSRRYGPFPGGAEDPERSGLHAYLNANKQGVTLDLATAPGKNGLTRLLAQADVLLVDGVFIDRLGEDWTPEQLAERYERLVVTSITPFGWSGPYRDYRGHDITVAAAGGISYGVGESNRAPLPLPGFQCDLQGGLSAAIATAFALLGRAATGRGQHVDISVMEVMASLHTGYYLPRYIYGGGVVGLRSGRTGNSTPYPNTVLPCKDGLVVMAAPQIEQWKRFIHLMGDPEWSLQPRYRNRRAMQWEYREEVDALIIPWLMQYTKQELLELFREHRIPFAPILTAADLLANAHLAERDSIGRYQFPAGGTFRAPALPIRLAGGGATEHRRAPTLGEQNDLLASDDPWPAAPRPTDDRLDQRDRTSVGPLGGLRVLDLGTAWAGNIAGRVLADFGADVIKVESWTYMDGSRKGKPIVVGDTQAGDDGKWPDMQPGFHVMARNKRSVALNLRTPGGRQILKQLAAQCDALVHNFSPGVLDRLGLPAEALLTENPRLVIVGQSMAGSDGPLRDYIGYNGTVKALSGLAGLVGYEGEEAIGMFQGLFSDVVSALTAAWATAIGLLGREASGHGRVIDVSQWEATLALVPEPLLAATIDGKEIGPSGSRHPLCCPYGIYPAAGDDAWVSVAVATDDEWRRLCAAIGRPELADDDRYATLPARQAHRAEVDAAIAAWTGERAADEATGLLQEAGVAAFTVQNIADIFFDEHLRARDAWVEIEHPLVGLEPLPGIPWKFSHTPGSVRMRAPLLGEHSAEILEEVVALDPSEFAALVASGVMEEGPTGQEQSNSGTPS